MKILFGFANTSDLSKLSPALQARNINMLKAAPSDIDLKGLYLVAQPGYQSYAANLPAFLYATETMKKTPLNREGYPVMTKPQHVIPLSMPDIYITFKNKDIPKALRDFSIVTEVTNKDKSSHSYTIGYRPGIMTHLSSSGYEKNVFPIARTISVEDLAQLVNVLRIASSFFRTHKYPAFTDSATFEYEKETHQTEKEERALTQEESDAVGPVTKKRMISMNEGSGSTWVSVGRDVFDEVGIKLKYAKPVDGSGYAWGDSSSIPTTDGIVFPFVEELAKWDDKTVLEVIGRHFLRCLGHTTDGCLTAHSQLSASWKRSIHKTQIGDSLSHLFKVIGVAITSQSRAFPVLEGHRYTGCYLSGSGFSLAIRGELFRPTAFVNNITDIAHFEGQDAVLKRILGMVSDGDIDDRYEDCVKAGGTKSMRQLNKYLADDFTLDPSDWELTRAEAAKLSYPQVYLRTNIENIQLVLSWIQDGQIPEDAPMHSNGLGQSNIIALVLSAFGSSVPSPVIPGAPKIQLTAKAPPRFAKTLVFRNTTLETAVADWTEVGVKGFTNNGPDRLSARYQYVSVKGEVGRDRWFSALHTFHMWSTRKQASVVVDTGDTGVGLDDGGVRVDAGVDMTGF